MLGHILALKDANSPPSTLQRTSSPAITSRPPHQQGECRPYRGAWQRGKAAVRERRKQSSVMAKSLPPYDQLVEEDYIDMDISSATFFCYTKASPPHAREFEFRMTSNPIEREPIPSPADELFYKGKLLPLHLPPRLQMVQKLLHNSNNSPTHRRGSDRFDERLVATAASTPFESCNVSPAASCYVSGELNPEDYLYECSTAALVEHHPKKPWSKKLRFMKQSNLGLKLKASKAYLKSLFIRPRCADEKPAVARDKECSNGYLKAGKRNPLAQILREGSASAHTDATTTAAKTSTEDESGHRRSFSGAIKWRSSAKSSSSASSSCSSSNSSSFSIASSNGGQPMLKRSSSVNSDVENSVQGAIAYCKRSQQLLSPKKSVSDVGYSSLTVSRIAADCEVQERPGLCRG